MGTILGNKTTNLLVGMLDRTSKTTMEVQNLTQGVLMEPIDLVSGIGLKPSTNPLRIINYQFPNLPKAKTTATLTHQGIGGVDVFPAPANTWLYMYIISDGTNEGTGCILSADPNCPQVSGYTHLLYVGCNRTNSNGTQFVHQILKSQTRAYFVGGTGTGTGAGTGALPLVAQGVAPMWTIKSLDGVVPPTGGPVGLVLRVTNYGGSPGQTLCSVAPNRFWSDAAFYINNIGTLVDQAMTCELLADTGNNFAYWAQSPNARVYAAYFDDPH